ncbi:MAG: LysR family transcriptional regulator [Bacteroidota bacterium]
MHYTLHQLQIFLKVTQVKSITRAADELNLTQPAVSIQLRNLQDQFEIPLTETIGKKLHVTEFGHVVADSAKKILEEVYALNYRALAYKGQLTGKLSISVVSTAKYLVPFFIHDFMRKHPSVEFSIQVTNKAKVIEALDKNLTDLSLVSILPEHLRVEKVNLLPNKLFLVGKPDGELQKKRLSREYLQQLPFIFREQGSGTLQVMERYLKKHNIKPRKTLELSTNEAVKQAVAAGLGFSLMPLIGMKNELAQHDLEIIPAPGLPVKSDWHLIWMKGKKNSPLAAEFIEFIRENRTDLVQKHFGWTSKY